MTTHKGYEIKITWIKEKHFFGKSCCDNCYGYNKLTKKCIFHQDMTVWERGYECDDWRFNMFFCNSCGNITDSPNLVCGICKDIYVSIQEDLWHMYLEKKGNKGSIPLIFRNFVRKNILQIISPQRKYKCKYMYMTRVWSIRYDFIVAQIPFHLTVDYVPQRDLFSALLCFNLEEELFTEKRFTVCFKSKDLLENPLILNLGYWCYYLSHAGLKIGKFML